MKLNLEIEKLEARIAPGGISTGGCGDSSKGSKGGDDGCGGSSQGSKGSKGGDDGCGHQKGNNGFGNGGYDGSNAGFQDITR